MAKLSNLFENMNEINRSFMYKHDMNLNKTGGVYDFAGKCVIYRKSSRKPCDLSEAMSRGSSQ